LSVPSAKDNLANFKLQLYSLDNLIAFGAHDGYGVTLYKCNVGLVHKKQEDYSLVDVSRSWLDLRIIDF